MPNVVAGCMAPADNVDHVAERFVIRSEEIGFPAPPMSLRIKLVESLRGGTLFARPVPAGPAYGIADWLALFSPARIEFGPHHLVRADLDPMPSAWQSAFQGVGLDSLTLHQNGEASVQVSGSREAVAAFHERTRARAPTMLVRGVIRARPRGRLLTGPQEEALRAAVELGYYLIPRPLTLRDVAARLHLSPASLSERLRRAEGRVITSFVREGGISPWDALSDARASAFDAGTWPALGES